MDGKLTTPWGTDMKTKKTKQPKQTRDYFGMIYISLTVLMLMLAVLAVYKDWHYEQDILGQVKIQVAQAKERCQ
jgi:cell division protein FtsL